MLFKALRELRLDPQCDVVHYKKSIKQVRMLGESWKVFAGKNQTLLSQIDEVIATLQEPSDEVFYYAAQLINNGQFDQYRSFDESIHPFGLNGISMHVNDVLNPLLEVASVKMNEVGIDPVQFYR